MASLIHELENNEALLLMFTSGELSDQDHAEVEQMLAGDSGLRAELASLSSAYDSAMTALAELDADQSALAGENHAIRQAKRAMRQWQAERLNREPVKITPRGRRIPAWAYASVAAAMVLIGTLTYWGVAGDPANTTEALVAPAHTGDADTQQANLLQHSIEAATPVAPVIDDAESQANSLLARSDDLSASRILLVDTGQ